MFSASTLTPYSRRAISVRAGSLLALGATVFVLMASFLSPQRAEALQFNRTWWGAQVHLNRSETNKLTYGSAGAAAVAVLIPDPTFSKIAAAGLGVFAAWTGYVYSIGDCVEFNEFFSHLIVPWAYRGGYCH